MGYGVNVSGGANAPYPVAGAAYGPCVGGAFNSVGAILVLFILLVIITRACLF